MSENWMGMMNQNYQAEKLLKRLQNNTIKIIQEIPIPKQHKCCLSFWLLHRWVIIVVDALAQAYIL